MHIFTVYPKGKAEPFKLKCDHFDPPKDGRFIIYELPDLESRDAYLASARVAGNHS